MSFLAALTSFATTSSVEESPVASVFEKVFPVAHNEDDEEEEKEEEEEEEDDDDDDEPEDCENSPGCAGVRHHFEECQERVTEGKGFEGENCIEELSALRRA